MHEFTIKETIFLSLPLS